MQISRKAGSLPGVRKVLVLLGTDSNKKVFGDLGLLDATVSAATANDLVISIEAESIQACEAALAEVDLRLKTMTEAETAEEKPRSLEEAADRMQGANVAMVSVPGQLARLDVTAALQRGLHVMLFSDNVSLADEAELKTLAVEKGLLLMGPDCGTSIINGAALALANKVRRGDIGVAGASGSGIQEVTCLIDRFGGGISHAVGVGGRDLRKEIGGKMMSQAIRFFAEDPSTRRLVLLSKPGDPEATSRVLAEAGASGLDIVACFPGGGYSGAKIPDVTYVDTLEAAAFAAMGRDAPVPDPPSALRAKVAGLMPGRRYLRGLYAGGTLCYETLFLLQDHIEVQSNVALRADLKLPYPAVGTAHCCVDMGEDEFTRGRPHPIIEPGLRLSRLIEEMAEPAVKVILLDVVLGYGANPDPATELAETLAAAGKGQRDGGPAVLIHVCGTEADPQVLSEQEGMLREAGAFLFPTNAQAARAALAVVDNAI